MNLKKMITTITFVVVLIAAIGFAKYKHITPLFWKMHSKINQSVFSDTAINGYDPVAYFINEQAIKGIKSLTYTWNDATWYFSSEDNLNLFKDNPEKYSPEFGGYCAFAVSKGFTANIDPEAFVLHEDKLYMFAEPKFRDEWLKGEKESVMKSQQNWE